MPNKPVPTDLEKLISEMEIDLMVLSLQDGGFADRYRTALMLIKTVAASQVSELERLKVVVQPILTGDLYVVSPLSLSWVNEGNRERMRKAIGQAVHFRESIRQIISIEGSVPHVNRGSTDS